MAFHPYQPTSLKVQEFLRQLKAFNPQVQFQGDQGNLQEDTILIVMIFTITTISS